MPGMNGFQFREEQLRDPRIAGIPVVVLSADRTTDEKARSMGAAGFARKPVKLSELIELARRYVGS